MPPIAFNLRLSVRTNMASTRTGICAMSSISAAMNTALSGMLAQQTKAAATASNVANADTPGYKLLNTTLSATDTGGVSAKVAPASPSDGDTDVDMATEMLNLTQAAQSYKANASVWEAGADMWDALKTVVRG
jgi:flagellar basal body rod protein FlgG